MAFAARGMLGTRLTRFLKRRVSNRGCKMLLDKAQLFLTGPRTCDLVHDADTMHDLC